MPNASCTNLESLALYLCRFLLILFIVYIARSIFTLWYLSIFTHPVEIGVGKFSDLSSSTNTIPSHVAYQNTHTEHTHTHTQALAYQNKWWQFPIRHFDFDNQKAIFIFPNFFPITFNSAPVQFRWNSPVASFTVVLCRCS